jgi:hypothetical protein
MHALMKIIITFWFHTSEGISGSDIVEFSRRTQLHGICYLICYIS